jgi:hypothetical protein
MSVYFNNNYNQNFFNNSGYQTVGEKNPINLPVVSFKTIKSNIRKPLYKGSNGTVYSQKNSSRLYKIFPGEKLKNGNEILISQIASRLLIAPNCHGAYLAQPENKVVIEMDFVGDSLWQYSQKSVSSLEKWDSTYPPEEEVLSQLFGSKRNFYFQLFSKLKTLAEFNISYTDLHQANIIPINGTIKLIDFGHKSDIEENIAVAANKTLRSSMEYFDCYKDSLKSFSQREYETFLRQDVPLIAWYREAKAALRKNKSNRLS